MGERTTDFYKHLKNLFLIEYSIEIIILFSLIKLYHYFFVASPTIESVKLILALLAPVILILVFVRNAIINFKSVIVAIPDTKVDSRIIGLLIKLTGYLNVREAGANKVLENIEKLSRYELLSIKPRLILKYMRYCYFTNNDKFIKSAKYIAETTQEKKYLKFIENNDIV